MSRDTGTPVTGQPTPELAPASGAWVAQFLAHFDAMDADLVVRGFPPTSPWWRSRIERFLRSGKKRWVLRVGRRGGKSSTLSRLLTAWILWGPWSVPPGDKSQSWGILERPWYRFAWI